MRESTAKDSSFPYWVALGSLVFVLALFFTNTAPALEEQQALRALKEDLRDLHQQYNVAIETAAQMAQLGTAKDGNYDLQSLLVAIDRHGYTPHELDAIYRRMAKVPTEESAEDREPR